MFFLISSQMESLTKESHVIMSTELSFYVYYPIVEDIMAIPILSLKGLNRTAKSYSIELWNPTNKLAHPMCLKDNSTATALA